MARFLLLTRNIPGLQTSYKVKENARLNGIGGTHL